MQVYDNPLMGIVLTGDRMLAYRLARFDELGNPQVLIHGVVKDLPGHEIGDPANYIPELNIDASHLLSLEEAYVWAAGHGYEIPNHGHFDRGVRVWVRRAYGRAA